MGNSVADISGVEVALDHWIGGQRVASKERFSNLSPIDGEELCDLSAGGKTEDDTAMDAAKRAFPAWAALGPEGRLPLLKRFAEIILERKEDFALVETIDNGGLLMGGLHRMVPRAAQNISFFADWALTLLDHTVESPDVINHIRYEPSGVAALIRHGMRR